MANRAVSRVRKKQIGAYLGLVCALAALAASLLSARE